MIEGEPSQGTIALRVDARIPDVFWLLFFVHLLFALQSDR